LREEADAVAQWSVKNATVSCAVISLGPLSQSFHGIPFAKVLEMPVTPHEYAQRLYSTLREADRPGTQTILVEMPPDEMEWTAIRDRITRATRLLES
jgi:L-threonylcarbamoyladenylate synthase